MILKGIIIIFFISIVYDMDAQVNTDSQVTAMLMTENYLFPNNPELPVLHYKSIFRFDDSDPASTIEKIFLQNNWGGSWRNGIYNYHHYHSTAHEALGVYSGWAEVQLGGPGNDPLRIEKGDLVVLPAGTAHKRISSGDGFAVVGAYPDNQSWDMSYGKEEETANAKQNIERVPLPTKDPVLGEEGVLFTFWK